MKLVLTCEHASNAIPGEYKYLFKEAGEILNSHRGYDPGALDLFQQLENLSDFSAGYYNSRLWIEVNRSIGHPALFSEFTKDLPSEEKKEIISSLYYSYRDKVEENIEHLLAGGEKVIHLSVHSFTPVLDEEIRNADIGLLYDPARKTEKEFCKNLKANLLLMDPALRIRFNYPYLGKADGFTTHLRKKFQKNYSGVELEVNQKFVDRNKMQRDLKAVISEALQNTLR